MAKGSKNSPFVIHSNAGNYYIKDTSVEVFPGEKVIVNHMKCVGYAKDSSGRTDMDQPIEKLQVMEYKVGDEAVYDSYNLAYIGTIVAITEKSVIVVEPYRDARKHRMTFEKFAFYNDQPIAAAHKRNAEWTD